VARRRGFFAEIQHQSKLADQRHQAALRQQAAGARRAEQAQRAAERAYLAAERASEADRKRLERAAADAHAAARLAEVDDLNADLRGQYETLDSLLEATLEVDDFVDLESLRAVVNHPPFARPDLERPFPVPTPIADPPLPVKHAPQEVKGLFGKKKKEAEALAAAEQQYAADYYEWQAAVEALPGKRAAQSEKHAEVENRRLEQLASEKIKYEAECADREKDAAEQNEALDQLISGLGYGTVDAVQEYVGIVLANSVYPDWFPVTHTAVFEPPTAELAIRVLIPGPDTIPAVKHYKYTKATDEIAPVAATQKDAKDRYASVVHNVALRTLHEVFEADRRGLFKSISLELGTETISPATGRPTYVPFVAVASQRETFEEIDLSAVVPGSTLEHLGAAVSKNPHGLVPIAPGGVRRV
jgi:restriction system protein